MRKKSIYKNIFRLLISILLCNVFLCGCKTNLDNENAYDTILNKKFTDKELFCGAYLDFEYKILESSEGYKCVEKYVLTDDYYLAFKNNIKDSEISEVHYWIYKKSFLIELAEMNKPKYNELLFKFYYPQGFKEPSSEKEGFLQLINRINRPWSTPSNFTDMEDSAIIYSTNSIEKKLDTAVIESYSDNGAYRTELKLFDIENQKIWIPVKHGNIGILNTDLKRLETMFPKKYNMRKESIKKMRMYLTRERN